MYLAPKEPISNKDRCYQHFSFGQLVVPPKVRLNFKFLNMFTYELFCRIKFSLNYFADNFRTGGKAVSLKEFTPSIFCDK